MARLKKRLEKLKNILLGYGKVLVAYSGGVDSTFLLKCSLSFLGVDNVLAVTAVSPTYTKDELNSAKKITRYLGIRHRIIHTQELSNSGFALNPKNRCYYCKKELFSKLRDIARKENINCILDGSNLDDFKDYRPGLKAKREERVLSPLAEASLSKNDIRQLSKKFGLKTWNQPQGACLASRFAYGQMITRKDLKRIEKGENYLRSLGINLVRLRHYVLGDKSLLARIEVDRKDVRKVTSCQLPVASYLRKLGYTYVTLDLEGYRSGSMNEALGRKVCLRKKATLQDFS